MEESARHTGLDSREASDKRFLMGKKVGGAGAPRRHDFKTIFKTSRVSWGSARSGKYSYRIAEQGKFRGEEISRGKMKEKKRGALSILKWIMYSVWCGDLYHFHKYNFSVENGNMLGRALPPTSIISNPFCFFFITNLGKERLFTSTRSRITWKKKWNGRRDGEEMYREKQSYR